MGARENFQTKMLTEATAKMVMIDNVVNSTTAAGASVDLTSYVNMRSEMNLIILQALFGAEVNQHGKLKFRHGLPTLEEINRLHLLFRDFYNTTERPLIDQFTKQYTSGGNVAIPSCLVEPAITASGSIKWSDIKNVREYIFGGKEGSVGTLLFSPDQMMQIAAIAENLRASITSRRIVVIGGIILTVAVGVTVASIVYNKHKDKMDEIEDDGDVSIDDLDEIPMVDVPMEDPMEWVAGSRVI